MRVARTLACHTRLRILASLVQSGEAMPTELADRLGMRMDVLSLHLGRLSAAGLITRRRSGARNYCTAQSPYSRRTLSGKVTSWLQRAMSSPEATIENCRVVQLRNPTSGDAEECLRELIFEAATAFANVRRHQILQRLRSGDAVASEELGRELSMSGAAVSRHSAKLTRRGYIEAVREGRILKYRLAHRFRTPLHAKLFGIVAAEWKAG